MEYTGTWAMLDTDWLADGRTDRPTDRPTDQPTNQPVTQLVKIFSAFYGTRRFITVFLRALHWSLS